MLFKKRHGVRYIATNFATILGIVLIWRGIWYVMDAVDKTFFGGSHAVTALISIAVGILILYLPEKNLSALSRL